MANLRELAAAAKVSIRTVSRVLKNQGYVHIETRRAVEEALKKVGYSPNLAARALKTARSHIVSVLTFTTDELRLAQVAALEERLRSADYLLSMTFHLEFQDKAKAVRIVNELIHSNPAGLVLLGHDPFVARHILPSIMPVVAASGLPYVLVDPRTQDFDSVFIDRARGVYDAVHFLAKRGWRELAFFGPKDERSRLDGYELALKELGLTPWILPFPGGDQQAWRASGRETARLPKRPRAVLVHSDHMALAFLAGLHDEGVVVPKQIALIGFDDRPVASLSWPTLTTVAQPSREIGQAAAEILLQKIQKEPAPEGGWSRIFPTRLIVRESA